MIVFDNENPVLLNNFLDYLVNIKHYSMTTISEYRIDLLVFFRFIKGYNELQLEIKDFTFFVFANVKESDILAFLVYLNYTRNCSASTRKRKISAIKSFYKWLFAFNTVGSLKNPTESLPSIQNIKRLPKHLSLEKAKKLINVFNYKNSKFAIRNNTIIILLLNCGLRASELININISDLNLLNGYIRIVGKGRKERICWLNSTTKQQLKSYLDIRNKNKTIIDTSEPLFLSYRNGRLNLRTVETIVENAYNLAGIKEIGYTTHTLRHTAATIIYQYVKSDVLLLKEILGHSTVKSTEIYTHIYDEKIKEAFNSNPLGNYIYRKSA